MGGRMEQKPHYFIPRYAVIPLGTAAIVNLAVYSGTKLITAGWPHHSFALEIDAWIPFWPAFISIYILAYVQWCIGYLMFARDSRKLCYEMTAGDIIAKLICGVCFLAFPTLICRPEVSQTGVWNALTRIIYWFDTPVNLFPSVHCLESWICCRGAMRSSKAATWYKGVMLVFTLLVFASTVLVKQHVVLDIAGGVVVAEIGLFVAKKFRIDRVFERLEPSYVKKSLHGAGE